ncbi:hypothetical protein SB861_50685 [Paraburkholderia sp. SIMBA_049]
MMTQMLAVRSMISDRESAKMIWTFVRHGKHDQREKMKNAPNEPLEQWFSDNGHPFKRLVAHCRTFSNTVPFVEVFAASTFHGSAGEGGSAIMSMYKTGKTVPEAEVAAPGTIGVNYQSKFEAACRARDLAIASTSCEEFDTAITKGLSAIEGYISHRVEIWSRHGCGDLLQDGKEAKISFEDKVKEWLPLMADGKKIDLSGRTWQDYQYLRGIRDGAIHPKGFARGATYASLADDLTYIPHVEDTIWREFRR